MTARRDFVCDIEDIWNAHIYCENRWCTDDCQVKSFVSLHSFSGKIYTTMRYSVLNRHTIGYK